MAKRTVPLDSRKRTMAERLSRSHLTAVHVTHVMEADVSTMTMHAWLDSFQKVDLHAFLIKQLLQA